LGLVLIAVPLVLRFVFDTHLHATITAALALIGLVIVCIPPLRAKTIRYRVTNYRIDYERGLIGKDIDTLELWHVEDIQFHQDYLDRLLVMGTITVISHDITTPRLVMHSLPNSRHLFDQLKQRIIAVKRQRGVLKMDTGS
jgi:membrane protein YdbS with pleckstrin-like domain